MDACTWTKLAPAAARAFGNAPTGAPRFNHAAVAAPGAPSVLIMGERGREMENRILHAQLHEYVLLKVACGAGWAARAIASTGAPLSHTHPGGTTSIGCFAACPTVELLSRGAPPAAAGSFAPPATAYYAASPAGAAAAACAPPGLAPCHDLAPYFLSERLSDVVLLAGDAALPAHRLVLAASPRFKEVRSHATVRFV